MVRALRMRVHAVMIHAAHRRRRRGTAVGICIPIISRRGSIDSFRVAPSAFQRRQRRHRRQRIRQRTGR